LSEQWSFEHEMIVRRFGAGPELVWIHGLGEWSANFDPIAHHPALDDFAHTLPDLPGYGRSPPPEVVPRQDSLTALASHLVAWLAPRPPAVLIGHSMGGVLATMVAEQVAVRGVIDLDGNLTRGDCTYSLQAASYSLEDFITHGFGELRAQVYTAGIQDLALRAYHVALVASSPAMFHRNAIDLIEASTTETLAERLANLRAPSLFIAGMPGGICEQSQRQLDRLGARWMGIQPSGHWVHLDQPDELASAIAGFVRELATSHVQ
jgi:pimeloyl-ACP methyl ester carboxylesterase